MRPKRFLFVALMLALVAGLAVFWSARQREGAPVPSQPAAAKAPNGPVMQLVTTPSVIASQLAGTTEKSALGPKRIGSTYRLTNTDVPVSELTRSDTAILLRAAAIDTASGRELEIPQHLKAGENPGSYIVQAQGAASQVFQDAVKRAGGKLIAYVPNNAFLVSATKEIAEALRAEATVRSVLPFEPYYKVDGRLIETAVKQEPLAQNTWLRVTFFEGADASSLGPLAQEIGATEPSPFGPQTVILPIPNGLAELAQRPEVQMIEPWAPRVLANDMTRVRVGLNEDTRTAQNWLDLTGSNVWINLNDLGVEGTHRDLVGRVFYQGTNGSIDIDGHGTHIAATLVGFPGTNIFTSIPEDPNRTNYNGNGDLTGIVDGSFTNASFRGLAPQGKLFVLPVAFSPGVNHAATDTYLIETAAATNYVTIDRDETLISNNSWNYLNATDYDSQAARYDAATRDALGELTGSQPVMYVFAAGNYGFGREDGFGGEPGFISSPGTAKNVITVGALEKPRFLQVGLTNIVENVQDDGSGGRTTNYVTNVVKVFELTTDSEDQVAAFSSRGNVAPLIEGEFGRFKPDLVAPGTFNISARSSLWNITNDFPQEGVSSNYYHTMTNLNGPFTEYRYDSGTSFSAPVVSGLLALVQEFFSSKVEASLRRNLSPALMKALMINSARSVSGEYDLTPNTLINYQGWGLVDIRRMLPTNFVTRTADKWTTQFVEQSPTNALATGQTRHWNISLHENAAQFPLRVTLVWTDPPGSPAVGAKLVNDLDLVVETEDGRVFHGNDILQGRSHTEARREMGAPLGNSGFRDYINNVENVIIPTPADFGTNFTIHVIGRRVNVKAVNDYFQTTGNVNEIVQDYALVISTENYLEEQPFFKFEPPAATGTFDASNLQEMVNGVPMLRQRVGANSALIVTNGVKEQWNFYEFRNSPANQTELNAEEIGKNVAFVTFTPPSLSIPRTLEADIDIYVSTNRGLLDLDPNAINGAWKSTTQGGTEAVVFVTNGIPGELGIPYPYAGDPSDDHVFYVGIKSEDQQGAEFSLMGISTARPFEEERNGKRILNVVPISQFIPDGVPNRPGAGIGVAIGLSDRRVLNASSYLVMTHEEGGDLTGIISHRNQAAVINNHSLFSDIFSGEIRVHFNDFFYRPPFIDLRDYPAGDPGPNPAEYLYSDGPGFLEEFAGYGMQGPWLVHMVDNAGTHVGRIERMEIQVLPIRDDLLPGVTVSVDDLIGQEFFPVDVPLNASRMRVILKQLDNVSSAPLEMLVKRDLVPNTNDFDFRAVVTPPADTAIIDINPQSQPPLAPGEYIIAVINNNPTQPVDFQITVFIEIDESGADQVIVGDSNVTISDDARTISRKDVTEDKLVAQAAVAIVANHARVSDLALRLISPQGTRIVLSENRGGFSADGFGSTNQTPNFAGPSYAVFTDDPVARWPIKFTPPPFGDNSAARGPLFGFGFEGLPESNRPIGSTFGPGPWRVATNRVTIISSPTAPEGTNYLNLNNGAVSRQIGVTDGRSYRLSFQYRGNPAYVNNVSPAFSTGTLENGALQNQQAVDLHYRLTETADPSIIGTDLFVASSNAPPFPAWLANDAVSQWISPSPINDNGHPTGVYTYHHSFVLNGWTLPLLRVEATADDLVRAIRFNGSNLTFTPPPGPGSMSAPVVVTPVDGLNTLVFETTVVQAPGPVGLRTRLTTLGGTAPNQQSVGTVAIRNTGDLAQALTATLTGAEEWRTYEADFVVSGTNNITLEFFSQFAPGLEIDDIRMEDTGTIFLMPEEPLALLEGERAMGEWRLEAWDNRTGAPTPAEIVDWQLILSTAEAPRQGEVLDARRLYPLVINNPRISGARPYYSPGVLNRREVEYFYFDTCPDSTFAKVTLITSRTNQFGRLELLMDRSGFPTGNPLTDDYQIVRTITNQTTIETTFTLENPAAAPLLAGRRVFMAVRNVSILNTNLFRIRVDYDGSCQFTPPPALPANVPFQYVTPSKATTPNGDTFTVAADSPTTLEVAIEGGGDVTIYASRVGEPGPGSAEVTQRITGESGSVALPGTGEWTIRIDNEADEPAFYTLTARMDDGFDVESVVLADGKLRFTWDSVVGRRYEIASSTDLVNWTPVTTVEATGATATYTDTQNASGTARFFRIQAVD